MGVHKGIRTNDFNFLDGVIQKLSSSYGGYFIVIVRTLNDEHVREHLVIENVRCSGALMPNNSI